MQSYFPLLAALVALLAPEPAGEVTPKQAIEDFSSYCDSGVELWRKSLCGPLIIVDPSSRAAVANIKPGVGDFERRGTTWHGTLPQNVPLANTSIALGGVHFAEILWPLPNDSAERRILMAHESFHRLQSELGIVSSEADNAHLDTKNGRMLARLEMEALQAALSERDWRPAARDALTFRAKRLALFPKAFAAEASLLANEGLAEYTGVRVGGGTHAVSHAVKRLEEGTARASLIRSFGYVVGPAYGLLLDRSSADWRDAALAGRSVPDLLLEQTTVLAAAPDAAKYGEATIIAEETQRDLRIQKRGKELTSRFVNGPTVTFPLVQMNIEFNPNLLFALGKAGTVYTRASIRDSWGVLIVEQDLLVSSDWKFARVPGPARMSGRQLSGPGWSAVLEPGYEATAGARTGDMYVLKRP